MPRGGRRAGRPGAKYPNRSDLALAPRTAPTVKITGQAYGAATDQAAMQQTVTAAAEATRPALPPQARPPAVDLEAPTTHPTRPVTDGLPVGPGPGSEALGIPNLTPVDRLKRMYRLNPNPDLLELLIRAEGF